MNTLKNYGAIAIILLTSSLLAACGGSKTTSTGGGTTGTSTISCTNGTGVSATCFTISGYPNAAVASANSSCTSNGGVAGTSCASNGTMGHCNITNTGMTTSTYFYDPANVTLFQSVCTSPSIWVP